MMSSAGTIIYRTQNPFHNNLLTPHTMMKQQEQVTDKSNYPRTGKRGVPQQFPRKLFEMLDVESNRIRRGSGCVAWSSCGRAFRIADVAVFSEEILPAYFKTSKFSSFQRNLNLVSFCNDTYAYTCQEQRI